MDEEDFNDFESAPPQDEPKLPENEAEHHSVHSQPIAPLNPTPTVLSDFFIHPTQSQMAHLPSQQASENDGRDWEDGLQLHSAKIEGNLIDTFEHMQSQLTKTRSQRQIHCEPTEQEDDYLSVGQAKGPEELQKSELNRVPHSLINFDYKLDPSPQEDKQPLKIDYQPVIIPIIPFGAEQQTSKKEENFQWQILQSKDSFQQKGYGGFSGQGWANLQPMSYPDQNKKQEQQIIIDQSKEERKESQQFVFQTQQPEARKQSEQFEFQEVSQSQPTPNQQFSQVIATDPTQTDPLISVNRREHQPAASLLDQEVGVSAQPQIIEQFKQSKTEAKEENIVVQAQKEPQQLVIDPSADDQQFGQFEETVQEEKNLENNQAVRVQQAPSEHIQIKVEETKAPFGTNIRSKQQQLQQFVDSLPDYSFLLVDAFNSL